MKKNYFNLVMIPIFLLASGFIILRYASKDKDKSESSYQLQKRKADDSNNKDWMASYKQAEAHLDKLRLEPGNTKSKLALASIFINEARAWGNHAYYDAAAMHYVNDVLKTEPKNFEASVMKSVILLSQHRFEDALAQAEETKKINPYNAFVYGILVDANVELGNYPKAIAYADEMTAIRPDIRSYSRVAYLREIHGDNPGAIEAMKLAVNAGAPGEEATAWARVQLAHLFENTGKLPEAMEQYDIALSERENYAFALGGKGKLMLHNNKPDEAIALFNQADALVDDVQFKEGLAEAYAQKGETKKVADLRKTIIKNINDHQHFAATDKETHYHAGMELAYAYLADNNMDEALKAAETEYKRRPNNIDVNECMAWVLYKSNQAAKALPYANAALSTNSKNPRLLARVALIYQSNNNMAKARELKETALSNSPVLSADLIKTLNAF
jgi:tetratricopeptide (TPR) repeat protein